MTTDEQIKVLRDALERIARIENKLTGCDWDEIEEARKVAHEALALTAPDAEGSDGWRSMDQAYRDGRPCWLLLQGRKAVKLSCWNGAHWEGGFPDDLFVAFQPGDRPEPLPPADTEGVSHVP